MKSLLKNLLFFPFWNAHFKNIHTCPNVKKGNFRIGTLACTTKLYSKFLIVATYTDLKRDIRIDTDQLASELRIIADHYTDGLVCPKEFIYKVVDLALTTHNHMPHTECNMRITQCGTCPAIKAYADPKAEELELKHQAFVNSL